uniref:Uncharacterized protein n=1 Tax=Acrobeloides nanus TaxID=290746 RepID=A0A914DLE1_9BILA
MGKKFFYQPSGIAIPTTAYDNNTLAYVLDGYYHQCNDICICSIEGICYTQTSYYALVNLVPFCEHGQCHVYAAPIVKGLYTPLKTEHNTIYQQPNPDNISVGINSKYIKVEAISCFGCKNIRNVKCFGQAEQVCTPPENSAGLIVTAGTISARIDKISLPIATCQTTDSLKYFWNASQYGVPVTAYNTSSAAFIIDSNGYCPDLCIRGEDGKFYEPLNDDDDFYMEFLSFCDGEF